MYNFSSLQVDIDTQLANQIKQWGYKNINQEDIFCRPFLSGRESDIHITILYGILTTQPDKPIRVLKKETNFQVTLKNITAFYNEEYDVIKIDVESEKLNRIHNIIKNDLMYRPIHDKFKPHITIAYVNKSSTERILQNESNMFKDITISVNNLSFIPPMGLKTTIALKN